MTHTFDRFLYLLGCSGPWCGGGLATCGSATGGLATCDGGAAAVCGVAENLMRCLHACRSIKPHVRSCWEMNYSTFPFGDFCLCSLFFCGMLHRTWQPQFDIQLFYKGAFTNYVCIFWHLTTYVPPLVCTFHLVNLVFF